MPPYSRRPLRTIFAVAGIAGILRLKSAFDTHNRLPVTKLGCLLCSVTSITYIVGVAIVGTESVRRAVYHTYSHGSYRNETSRPTTNAQ